MQAFGRLPKVDGNLILVLNEVPSVIVVRTDTAEIDLGQKEANL